METFKVIIVGNSGVGKTSLVKKLAHGAFPENHLATLGVEVAPIDFQHGNQTIVFNTWDCAGDPRYGGQREGYWLNAKGAILVHDENHENIDNWIDRIHQTCPGIPIAICWNKIDLLDQVPPEGYGSFSISVANNLNLLQPFQWLVSRIKNQDVQLQHVEGILADHDEWFDQLEDALYNAPNNQNVG